MPRGIPKIPKIPRRGAKRTGLGGGRVQLVWDTRDLNGTEIIKYDQPTISEIKLRLYFLAEEIAQDAQNSVAWQSHPDLHPSAQYPFSKTAKQGIHCEVRGGYASDRNLRIQLLHNERTIFAGPNGTYNYGYVLETGKYPIFDTVMSRWQDDVIKTCQEALNDLRGFVPDYITEGGR